MVPFENRSEDPQQGAYSQCVGVTGRPGQWAVDQGIFYSVLRKIFYAGCIGQVPCAFFQWSRQGAPGSKANGTVVTGEPGVSVD